MTSSEIYGMKPSIALLQVNMVDYSYFTAVTLEQVILAEQVFFFKSKPQQVFNFFEKITH